MVEPWLRGTWNEIDPIRRQVLHALELTQEDAARWCSNLTHEELESCPFDLPSVGFQLRHMARSLDRLLTYAEDHQLRELQRAALASEMTPSSSRDELFQEFRDGMASAMTRVRAIPAAAYELTRGVGRDRLPSTVAGLLIHCAEHTQRHTGQMITTAKVLLAQRRPTEAGQPRPPS